MCGLAGFVDVTSEASAFAPTLGAMLRSISHRGPDDEGVWMDPGVAIGHRRLSILDLSPTGHQPMESPSKRYVLAFNGEIYNHAALRKELTAIGTVFRGHSDTEVLLALIDRFGLHIALNHCVGMFAIVLWDRQERVLRLARDRFGEKPLYYGWHQGRFLFGSELKALRAHPAFQPNIDEQAVALLLRYGYIPAPHCVFADTWKLQSGSVLSLSLSADATTLDKARHTQSLDQYWSHADVALRGMSEPFGGSFDEASRRLEALLLDAVKLQMHADVPLGAFLSGGIDSSTVVALMQAQQARRVKTFAIGFDDGCLNEADHAKAVAAHLGTDHTELYVSTREALNVIPELPRIYDEPFADPSQIPTYCVARLAKRQVTVSLSGDGGDELFGGYPKYAFGERFANLPLRRLWGKAVAVLPWTAIEHAGAMVGGKIGKSLSASRFETLHALLAVPDHKAIADTLSMVNRHPTRIMAGCDAPLWTAGAKKPAQGWATDYRRLAMIHDRERYLPDDILVKVDRATMAVSLESRAPLLDHRVAEFTARLPIDFLVRGAQTKRILCDVLYRYVPRLMVDRPKAGFSIPLSRWLREELRDWAFDLLTPGTRKAETPLDLPRCRALLDEHVRGDRDNSRGLWPALMLEAWQAS